MGTYARVNTTTGAVVERINQAGFDPGVGTKAGTKWVPRTFESAGSGPVPANGAVESVVMGAITYEGRQFDRKVSVVTTYRPKTQAELDKEKDDLVDKLVIGEDFQLLAKILFKHENRLRALEAKAALTPAEQDAGSVTAAQFKAYLRALM